MQAWKKSLAETSWGVVTPGSTPGPQPATPHPPSDGQEEKVRVDNANNDHVIDGMLT